MVSERTRRTVKGGLLVAGFLAILVGPWAIGPEMIVVGVLLIALGVVG